jgi:hypothetical protein
MKNFVKLTVAASAILAFSGNAALAQFDGDNTASLTVLEDLEVTADDPLLFGEITTSDEGTIIIEPGGDVGAASDITPSGTTGAATFDVSGPASANIDVSVPVDIVMEGPGDDIPVTFDADPAGPATLDGTGELVVAVGGTATVPAGGVDDGEYEGTFTLVVDYD